MLTVELVHVVRYPIPTAELVARVVVVESADFHGILPRVEERHLLFFFLLLRSRDLKKLRRRGGDHCLCFYDERAPCERSSDRVGEGSIVIGLEEDPPTLMVK